ncbi:MAG: tetratricopeptide repeat protein [Pseudomonadota bacterium]
MDFRFAQPEALWGLIPLGFFAIYLLWKRAYRRAWFSWRRFWLSCLGFLFCIFALARPQSGSLQGELEPHAPNLLVALDISQSMLAEDITPNRLGFSVYFTERLLDALVSPRAALYPFAASGFLQMPFTTDVFALQESLQSLDPSAISHQGTDFNEMLTGLHQMMLKMESSTADQFEGWQPPKIILLSDGESHHPLNEDVLKPFEKKKIAIYTVGVGTPEGAPVFFDALSERRVITKLDPAPLQTIAMKTGGAYFSASYENIPILLQQLNRSFTFGKRSQQFRVQNELFQICFLFSLIFFFWEFCFARWQYVIKGLAFFLLISLSQLGFSEDDQLKAIQVFNRGVDQVAKGNLEKAAELFEESSLTLQNPSDKKKAFFNLGNAFLKMGDPEQALESYQKAFQTHASNREFEESTNKIISENMALASQILEQMKKQSQSQGEDENSEGDKKSGKDPKGPQKFQGEALTDQQKQKLFNLIASEEKQTQRRIREQNRRPEPKEENPW